MNSFLGSISGSVPASWNPSQHLQGVSRHPSQNVEDQRESALWSCPAQRWNWPACSSPDLAFFPFSKGGLYFPISSHQELHWISGTSQIWHSGLTILCASSLSTFRYISSGPMDLSTFSFLKWSHTWSSPRAGSNSPSPPLPLWLGQGIFSHFSVFILSNSQCLSSHAMKAHWGPTVKSQPDIRWKNIQSFLSI